MTSRPNPESQRDSFLLKIRQICLNFPETEERLNHGMPAFAVKNRSAFVFVQESKQRKNASIWFKALREVQEELIEQDPDRFFAPPYLGPAGGAGLRLDIDLDGLVRSRSSDGRGMEAGSTKASDKRARRSYSLKNSNRS